MNHTAKHLKAFTKENVQLCTAFTTLDSCAIISHTVHTEKAPSAPSSLLRYGINHLTRHSLGAWFRVANPGACRLKRPCITHCQVM